MINYTLPDFTVNLGLNLFFVRLLRERPEMAREGVAVTSLYGCFPGCVMNGGRTYLRERTSPAAMERTFAIMAEYGLVPRLTFTNSLVSEETLADPYFNDICLAAARFGGEAIVYDDAAGAYLRENYGMPLVLSATREVADAATFNGLARSFDWIVLSNNAHKDPGGSRRSCRAREGRDHGERVLRAGLPPPRRALPPQQRRSARRRPTPLPLQKRPSRLLRPRPEPSCPVHRRGGRRHVRPLRHLRLQDRRPRRGLRHRGRGAHLLSPSDPNATQGACAVLAREMRRQ